MRFLVGKEIVGTDIAKLFCVDRKGRAQTYSKQTSVRNTHLTASP